MRKLTALEVADYIINSPYLMYEDGDYYIHWNPVHGLNYKGNSDPDNIIISIHCSYADGLSREEFETKESVNDSDFMSVCDALADKLNEKIENEE